MSKRKGSGQRSDHGPSKKARPGLTEHIWVRNPKHADGGWERGLERERATETKAREWISSLSEADLRRTLLRLCVERETDAWRVIDTHFFEPRDRAVPWDMMTVAQMCSEGGAERDGRVRALLLHHVAPTNSGRVLLLASCPALRTFAERMLIADGYDSDLDRLCSSYAKFVHVLDRFEGSHSEHAHRLFAWALERWQRQKHREAADAKQLAAILSSGATFGLWSPDPSCRTLWRADPEHLPAASKASRALLTSWPATVCFESTVRVECLAGPHRGQKATLFVHVLPRVKDPRDVAWSRHHYSDHATGSGQCQHMSSFGSTTKPPKYQNLLPYLSEFQLRMDLFGSKGPRVLFTAFPSRVDSLATEALSVAGLHLRPTVLLGIVREYLTGSAGPLCPLRDCELLLLHCVPASTWPGTREEQGKTFQDEETENGRRCACDSRD